MKNLTLNSILTKALFLFVILIAAGCKYNYYYPVDFDLDISSVTAVDLEEDGYWLSTGQDEIELYYTLASLDKNNKLVSAPQRRHYGPHEFTYRGETQYGYSPLSVNVPAKGKVYFSVHLTENDDYFSVIQTIEDAKTIVDIAEFVSRNKKKSKIAARSLKMASRTLNWLGIALTIVDILDTNDRLLGVCIVLDEEQLKAITAQTKVSGTLRGAGSNWGDRFDYRVNFSLLAQEAYGKAVKERIKSKAPNFYFNISPFIVDQNLNDYWSKYPDRLLVESSQRKDEYEWSDGLYNQKVSAHFGFCVSPAFKMGRSSYGKFFLEGGYQRMPYLLNFDHNYQLGSQYFQNPSGLPTNFTVGDIELKINQYNGAALFKIMSRKVVWDIGGGVLYQEGRTKFRGLETTNPAVHFDYNENQNILEKKFLPYGFTKLGFGRIKGNSGFMVNFGVMAFQPNYTSNSNFGIYSSSGSNNWEVIPVSPENLKISYSFGMDFFF